MPGSRDTCPRSRPDYLLAPLLRVFPLSCEAGNFNVGGKGRSMTPWNRGEEASKKTVEQIEEKS